MRVRASDPKPVLTPYTRRSSASTRPIARAAASIRGRAASLNAIGAGACQSARSWRNVRREGSMRMAVIVNTTGRSKNAMLSDGRCAEHRRTTELPRTG
jgi:hypothetical protein